jgi:hypothetical protein
MATKYKTSIRNTRLGDVISALGATARLLVYTGTEPALTASPTGTLLCTFTLANPVGPAASGGVATWTNPSNVTAAASGTPGYYRVIDGSTDDGTHTQVQGSAGVGSGDLNFGSTIASGGTVSITSIAYTEGNP